MDNPGETPLVALFQHNVWANLRLLDACAGLTDAQLDASTLGTFGTIRDTLLHLVAAEERYLGVLTSRPPDPPLRRGEWPGVAALRAHAREAGDGLAAAAGTVRLTDVLHAVFQGEATTLPAHILLIQAINHATEHRTHITTILTQQGLTPPTLDGWTYMGEGR